MAGHPFPPCYLASPVLISCLLPGQVAHRLSKQVGPPKLLLLRMLEAIKWPHFSPANSLGNFQFWEFFFSPCFYGCCCCRWDWIDSAEIRRWQSHVDYKIVITETVQTGNLFYTRAYKNTTQVLFLAAALYVLCHWLVFHVYCPAFKRKHLKIGHMLSFVSLKNTSSRVTLSA